MKLLALDSATEACSAALLNGDRLIVRYEEPGRGHAERILFMIDELLREGALKLTELDAIAFGRGPGGFTGVRLATSVTQGLAFGAGLPVVPVSNLRAVAQRAFDAEPRATRVLVCNDARMKEVYWAAFARDPEGLAQLVGTEHVGAPHCASVEGEAKQPGRWYGAGTGFGVYPELVARLGAQLLGIDPTLLPRAEEMIRLATFDLAAGKSVPAEEAMPVYLRDEVAKPMPPS